MRSLRPAALGAAVLALVLSAGSTPPAAAAPATDRAGTVDGWTVRTPSALGLRGTALERGAARARRLDSTCFAVLRNGKLARDWNWRLGRDEPREVFSITKSVTATLVGIAVRDGDLRLDDRVSRWVRQWRGTASESVTVRNLLSNDSGRFWSLETDYTGLLSARSRTRYAVSLPQQHPPGTAWAYNNAAIQVLEAVLERATGEPVARFAETRLFEPLGMTHSTFITDRADDAAVFYGMRTTCLDIARLGRLHLPVDDRGQPLRPVTGQLAPGAPEELYAALGFGGQVLLVDPTTRTMVVRLGLPAQPGEEAYGFTDAARVLTRALR